ncbi:MAG TPA: hypothetical protein VJA26_03095 [Gammaproteobacteria bacterium]|nr:hypothetical protein [Gammaproteobacteria bacterium]
MIKSRNLVNGWRLAILIAATVGASGAAAQQAQAPAPSAEKQRMIDLGIEHATARGLYDHLKQQANGGQPLTWRNVPDWTGILTREASPFFWDPDQGSPTALPTAKLTPEYEKMLMEKLDRVNRGIEFDPLSNCEPAGMPRWIVEPFLKEFVVTPGQTWLINEMQNEIRRVYTDGRDHPSAADAYPLWEGDSIGFWDGDKLVIHTSQMRAGQYQRIQPFYSEQVEIVEVWSKTANDTIVQDVWAYDAPALAEPWYTRQVLKRLSNDDNSLRIRYWDCGENQNNVIEKTEEGTSDFSDFTFTEKDDQ